MSYGGLVSFGGYTFANLGRFDYNFAEQKTQLLQLAGMDGGFDVYGDDPAPAPIGKVTQDIMVIASDRAAMDALRDAVNTMVGYGMARLTYQPTLSTDARRWTWARLERVSMPQDKGQHSDIWQKVTLTFSCPEPVWWVDSYVNRTLDDGYTLQELEDGGFLIGDYGYTIDASGASTTDTVTNNGNTKYLPMLTIEPGVGQSCANPKIQRLDGTLVVDEVQWMGTLAAGDILSIDGRSGKITVNGSPDWGNVSYLHSDFLRLMPGDNNIKIIFANGGDAALVTLYFRDSYR